MYTAPAHARDERTLVVDLWLPTVGQPTPAVVYIHGGGWKMGTQYRPLSSRVCTTRASPLRPPPIA